MVRQAVRKGLDESLIMESSLRGMSSEMWNHIRKIGKLYIYSRVRWSKIDELFWDLEADTDVPDEVVSLIFDAMSSAASAVEDPAKKKELKSKARQAYRKLLELSREAQLYKDVDRSLGESSAVFYPSIKKGMEAGRKASAKSAPSYRSRRGETWEEELGRIRRERDQKEDMRRRFASAGKYWKKVFGDKAAVYYRDATIEVGGPYRVKVTIEPRDSFAGSVFVVKTLKTTKVLDSKEFGIGIGAKESIARFAKKVAKQVAQEKMSEGKSQMKLTKEQLQEMVREAIREQLEERHGMFEPDARMSRKDLESHLEKEREKKRNRDDVRKKRHGVKQSMRGMELECGPDMDRGEDEERQPRSLAIVFADREELGESLYESSANLDDFCAAYIEAALWSTNDESDESGGVPLDENYSVDDISEETLRKMQKDCDKFQELAGEMIEDQEEQAGHDFWLTRNGHGAGFWDGDWPEHGDALTELSKKFGEVWLIVTDDGMIEQY